MISVSVGVRLFTCTYIWSEYIDHGVGLHCSGKTQSWRNGRQGPKHYHHYRTVINNMTASCIQFVFAQWKKRFPFISLFPSLFFLAFCEKKNLAHNIFSFPCSCLFNLIMSYVQMCKRCIAPSTCRPFRSSVWIPKNTCN